MFGLFKSGGVVQKGSSIKSIDKKVKAKPVGYRYTDALAKKLGVSVNAKPTQAHIAKYEGNGVYKEVRKNRSDKSLRKKI